MKLNNERMKIKIINEIRGAVARAWCHPENSFKGMDSTLAEAIVQEILKLLENKSGLQCPDDCENIIGRFCQHGVVVCIRASDDLYRPRKEDRTNETKNNPRNHS